MRLLTILSPITMVLLALVLLPAESEGCRGRHRGGGRQVQRQRGGGCCGPAQIQAPASFCRACQHR